MKFKKYYYKSRKGTILECDEPLGFYVKAKVLICQYTGTPPGTIMHGWHVASFTRVKYQDIRDEIKK